MRNFFLLLLLCASSLRAQNALTKSDAVRKDSIARIKANNDSIRDHMFRASLLSMDAMQARYESQRTDYDDGVHLAKQKAGESQNLFAQARFHYRTAIGFDKTYYPAWNGLGTTYYFQGQVRESIPYYKESVRLNNNYTAGWLSLGKAYDNLGQRDSAIYAFRQGIRADSSHVQSYQELSRIYMETKDTASALGLLRTAARYNSTSELPLNTMADIYLQYNDTVHAVAVMETAAKLAPRNLERLVFLTDYFKRKGDTAKFKYYSGLADAERKRQNIPKEDNYQH